MASRRQSGPSGNPYVVPVIMVGVLGLAALLITMKMGERDEAPKTEVASFESPWGDKPKEQPPGPGLRSTKGPRVRPTPLKANPLAKQAIWLETVEMIEEAEALLKEAKAARDNDDRSTYNEKGRAAKDLYDRAVEKIVGWEEDLIDARGDEDPDLLGIQVEIKDWNEKRLALSKSTF